MEVVLITSSAYIFWEGKLVSWFDIANSSIVYSIFRNRRLFFEKQMENVRVGWHSLFCIHIIIICLLFHDCLILYLRPRLSRYLMLKYVFSAQYIFSLLRFPLHFSRSPLLMSAWHVYGVLRHNQTKGEYLIVIPLLISTMIFFLIQLPRVLCSGYLSFGDWHTSRRHWFRQTTRDWNSHYYP